MDHAADIAKQDFSLDGTFLQLQAPPPPPPPLPADAIPKSFHLNPRHRMTPKKPVVTQKCEVCDKELIGQVVIDAHMKGSKHAKKLKAKELLSNLIDAGQVGVRVDGEKPGMFKCELCNVSLNSSQQLDVHNAGAKHKTKLSESGGEQAQNRVAVKPNEPTADSANEVKTPAVKVEKTKSMIANPLDLVCTVCNITVNSPQQLEQHLNSKKHQDREAGRVSHRPGPYSRGGRGGRGGLGSHGRGGKGSSSKYTSLSNSFKSAGYSNSFIKPEGGVILPPNCGTNKGPNADGSANQHGGKPSNFGGQFKNRGNFGSLTPYVNAADGGRGGYTAHGGAARGGWSNSQQAGYGAHPGYSGYDYGYNYSGYENAEAYGGYGMMQPGPPPTY